METLNIFDDKFHVLLNNDIKNILLETTDNEETAQVPWIKSSSLSCSYCRIEFTDSNQQREHYKLDWHRYNLKQSLNSREPITEEAFEKKNQNDEVSSISGSDTDKEEETLDSYITAQGKIFLQNDSGTVFSIYKSLIFERKEEECEDDLANRLTKCVATNKQWTVLMLGGGHFAGAVFQGDNPILHKTFHCYTVRQGQGGSQSARDGKSGGSHPKSAGASLRRYNEQALVQHIRSIVEQWNKEIADSSLIFYRASGPYNRSVLFAGNSPLLNRSDSRLRTIPFSTRRATFTEVKRVHSLLTSVQVYTNLEAASSHIEKQTTLDARKNKTRTSNIHRSKSRERIERALPCPIESSSPEDDGDSESDSPTEEDDLKLSDREVSFEQLEQMSVGLKPREKKIHKKKKPKKSKAKKLREQEERRKKNLLDILHRGNVVQLKELLEERLKFSEDNDKNDVREAFINEILDEEGNSLLHITCLNEHVEMMRFLLENEANPCLKNKTNHTAYTCTQSKDIREALKEYARENPTKYNYNKAQIPINSLTPEELAEKKKAQRKVKKEKEKIKKKATEIKRQEEAERERFLKLSDREKRALAAERRILGQTGKVVSRCFLCASDITGKVPFEYMGNRFCSVDCLKAHRMQHPLVLST